MLLADGRTPLVPQQLEIAGPQLHVPSRLLMWSIAPVYLHERGVRDGC